MRALDPVTLAVLNGRLVQIADEMDATLYRSAFNPIIAEAHDACHGLYHAETGATLVQGTSGLPSVVGAMAFAVKAVIDKVRADNGLKSLKEAGREPKYIRIAGEKGAGVHDASKIRLVEASA